MGSLFGSKAPPPPTPAPVAPMPDTAAPLVLEAQRRQAGQILQRGGRSSTFLSDAAASSSSDGPYSRRNLA